MPGGDTGMGSSRRSKGSRMTRNVFKTSSTEVPEEASECVVGIQSRLPSSIGVPLATVL